MYPVKIVKKYIQKIMTTITDDQKKELYDQSLRFLKSNQNQSKNDYLSWLYFLKNHRNYTPDFWNFKPDGDRHVFMSLLQDAGSGVLHLWNEWRQECDPKLFVQKDQDGKALMHHMWDKVEECLSSKYRTAFPFYKALREAQEDLSLTDWMFLDKRIDSPGEGWLNALLRVDASDYQNSSQKSDIEKITLNIVKAFPQHPDPTWWMNCKNASQMVNFASRGLSLHDEISVGTIKMPFATWAFSSRANYSLQHEIKKSNLLSAEEINDLSSINKNFGAIAPKDRRSSVGYIKQIVAFREKDSLGRSSFDYCLLHRPDLTHLLCEAIRKMPKEDVEFFCAPDKNDFTFATRVFLCTSEENFSRIKNAVLSKGVSFDMSSKISGWLALEYSSRHWIKILKDYGSVPSTTTLKSTLSLEEIFGTDEGQKNLADFWEANFEKALVSLERSKKSSLKKALIRQSMTWFNVKNKHSVHINETLSSFYKVALLAYLQSKKQDDIAQNINVLVPQGHNVPELLPTTLSKALSEAVLGSSLFEKGHLYESNQQLKTLASRCQILSEIGDLPRPVNQTRKM